MKQTSTSQCIVVMGKLLVGTNQYLRKYDVKLVLTVKMLFDKFRKRGEYRIIKSKGQKERLLEQK